MNTPLVQVTGLRKKFMVRHEQLPSVKRLITRLLRPFPTEVLWALDDINLSIAAGESVGIIGHNGSGKSTLLRMIAGIFQPTEGLVEVTGRCGGLFELAAGFTPDLNGMDNIYLSGALMGYSKKQVEACVPQVVEFSELGDFLSVPIKHYSSGMALRLGFAVAVAFEPEVLLVDEVLAVADEHFQRKAYRRLHELQNKGHAVVMVSHEMAQIHEMCQRIIWLQNGRLMQDGPAQDVIASYMASVEAENGAG